MKFPNYLLLLELESKKLIKTLCFFTDVDIPRPSPDDNQSNNTGYIVAVSLLSVCIVVLIIAAIAFYYYKIRWVFILI